MTDYRRCRIPGGTYFFTVNLADRRQSLLLEHIDALRGAFREVRNAHPFSWLAPRSGDFTRSRPTV
jgi:putative transposase